tara:strand:+ start:329 stop:538 length:210 start_codon:yes stop_codon:yes gene_type:complete
VKKINENISSDNLDASSNQEQSLGKIKTTNVNILLNRVRLDQKKAFKKKLIFSLLLIAAICLLATYFTV